MFGCLLCRNTLLIYIYSVYICVCFARNLNWKREEEKRRQGRPNVKKSYLTYRTCLYCCPASKNIFGIRHVLIGQLTAFGSGPHTHMTHACSHVTTVSGVNGLSLAAFSRISRTTRAYSMTLEYDGCRRTNLPRQNMKIWRVSVSPSPRTVKRLSLTL